MKFTVDKTLVKYGIYIIVLVTILYVMYRLVSKFELILGAVMSALSGLLAILTPFIIALVVAYLLHPIVCWIECNVMNSKRFSKSKNNNPEKHEKLKRTLSVLVTYLLVIGIIVVLVYCTYVMIGGQINRQVNFNAVLETISSYSERYTQIYEQLRAWLENSGLSDNLKQQFINTAENANEIIGSAISKAFNQIRNLGNNILNVALGLVIAFYILKDLEYFKKLCTDVRAVFAKNKNHDNGGSLLAEINSILASFIRGQLLDALLVGILCSIGLSIIRLDFAVLIGMTAGISNIIPYFGPIIGSVPAIIVGLLSGSPIKALLAVVVMIVVQQIDSVLISPRIVGDSVGLHPVFVMLSIIVGGAYFGLWGMLIAVPIAAIIKMFLVRWFEDRQKA